MRTGLIVKSLLWIGGVGLVVGWLATSALTPVCGCEEPPSPDDLDPGLRLPVTLPGQAPLGEGAWAGTTGDDTDDVETLEEFLDRILGDPQDAGGIGLQDLLEETGGPLDATEIYERVAPAVAFVVTDDGSGSGILIDDRHVATNAHVVWPSTQARVYFPDGTEYEDAPVTGWDLIADLAIIELPAAPGIIPAPLADDGIPAVGSEVYFVGYPSEEESYPQAAITRGLVSRTRDWAPGGMTYIQTDAAILGGQSGGALVDEYGRVVGVAAMSFTDGNGGQLAFAIAVDELRERYSSLLEGGATEDLGVRFGILVDPDDGRSLRTGEMFAGALDSRGDLDRFEIELEAGQTVVIGVGSVHFDADVTIENKFGDGFAVGRATGKRMAGPNAVLEFTATTSGTHVITVGDARGEMGGAGYYLLVL